MGQGHIGADETYFPERTIVTRGPAGSCTISITAVVGRSQEDDHQADDGLDCLVQDVTKNAYVTVMPPRYRPLDLSF